MPDDLKNALKKAGLGSIPDLGSGFVLEDCALGCQSSCWSNCDQGCTLACAAGCDFSSANVT